MLRNEVTYKEKTLSHMHAYLYAQFALRLYNEERYLEKPNEALRLRTTNCNKYPWQ